MEGVYTSGLFRATRDGKPLDESQWTTEEYIALARSAAQARGGELAGDIAEELFARRPIEMKDLMGSQRRVFWLEQFAGELGSAIHKYTQAKDKPCHAS